jgi:hypothetical protein
MSSNFDILMDLQILNFQNLNKTTPIHPYKNVDMLIKLRNLLKFELKQNIISNFNEYKELYLCLYQFDKDFLEIEKESLGYINTWVASPIYHILLSDEELYQMVH